MVIEVSRVVPELVDMGRHRRGQAIVLLEIDDEIGLCLLPDLGKGGHVFRRVDRDADQVAARFAHMLWTATRWAPPMKIDPARTDLVSFLFIARTSYHSGSSG
jgi:hypothetical protein